MVQRPTNAALLLRVAGVVIWICSGVPALKAIITGEEGLGRPSLAIWTGAFVLFGTLFWRVSKAVVGANIKTGTIPMVAIQSIAALVMFDRVCTSFESVLLIVVAAEVGFMLALRFGIAWILAQTVVMFLISVVQEAPITALGWSARTFGFEVLTLITAYLGASESRAKVELMHTNAELRATRELLASSTRIAERVRISRELHDLLGHHLTALSLNLEIASHLATNGALEPLEKAKSVTKLLLADVREAVSSLREREAVDLTDAMHALVDGVSMPEIHLEMPDKLGVTDPEHANAILRCVQEIITNAIKHADASHLWLSITRSASGVEVFAKDDGRGASTIRPGNGINGMRERLAQIGGTLAIEPAQRGGFSLKIAVPMEATT